MILINTSSVLAEILPELMFEYDPDLPFQEAAFTQAMMDRLNDLFMKAFYQKVQTPHVFDRVILDRLRTDKFLLEFSTRRWTTVKVVDTDGTYILIFEET